MAQAPRRLLRRNGCARSRPFPRARGTSLGSPELGHRRSQVTLRAARRRPQVAPCWRAPGRGARPGRGSD
eukprot:2078597-Alexandrium_andersonii.AAC.1